MEQFYSKRTTEPHDPLVKQGLRSAISIHASFLHVCPGVYFARLRVVSLRVKDQWLGK